MVRIMNRQERRDDTAISRLGLSKNQWRFILTILGLMIVVNFIRNDSPQNLSNDSVKSYQLHKNRVDHDNTRFLHETERLKNNYHGTPDLKSEIAVMITDESENPKSEDIESTQQINTSYSEDPSSTDPSEPLETKKTNKQTIHFVDEKDEKGTHKSGGKILCGRSIPLLDEEENSDNMEKENKRHKLSKEKDFIVLIGDDNHGYGQTNNQLNAIFRAQDYATDLNAKLALGKKGWAIKTLHSLFDPTIVEEALNATIVDIKHYPPSDNIYYNLSRHMYFYHTEFATPEEIEQKRLKLHRKLWSNPTRKNPKGKDMCSSIIHSNLNNNNKAYTVVHTRDMSDGKEGRRNSCFVRLRNNSRRNGVHPSGSCTMSASYIKSILRPINKLDQDIYVISNGDNTENLAELRKDEEIGKLIKTVPKEGSWAGGDMMMAILADVFIGTPISTFAGNIARARIALGLETSPNYLFLNSEMEPFCNSTCLFNKKVMSDYVG